MKLSILIAFSCLIFSQAQALMREPAQASDNLPKFDVSPKFYNPIKKEMIQNFEMVGDDAVQFAAQVSKLVGETLPAAPSQWDPALTASVLQLTMTSVLVFNKQIKNEIATLEFNDKNAEGNQLLRLLGTPFHEILERTHYRDFVSYKITCGVKNSNKQEFCINSIRVKPDTSGLE